MKDVAAMTSEALENFGESLRTLRRRHGLTLRALADKIYINEKTLCQYETGRTTPSLNNAIIISNYFGVSISSMCGLKGLKVVNEQGIAPYCPVCGSGEYMHNPDENENEYCGQCGCKLDWEDVHNGVNNEGDFE